MVRKRGKHTAKKLSEGGAAQTHLDTPPEVLRALARKEANLERARHDKNAFIEYVLRDQFDKPLKQGRIHREWQTYSEVLKRLMIIGPRHHGKTLQSIGHVLFKVGQDVNELIKFVCASDKKAIKRLTQVRKYLKDSDELHAVFPHMTMERCAEWNKHMITLERPHRSPEPTIEALGITSSGTGDRATGILVDDGVDRRNSITLPKTREAIKESWDDWYNLLGPDSWMLWISTLWHNADLTHELMSNPEYAVLWYEIDPVTFGSLTRYPDGVEYKSEESLWPEMWSRERLRERKRVSKARGFARSFSNRPMADSDLRCDPSWIRPWDMAPPTDWSRVVSLDLASSQSTTADYTGVVVASVCPWMPKIHIAEAYHVRLSFPDKIALVNHLNRHHRPEFIVVELAAGGRELAEYMVKHHAVPLRGIKPHGANKGARLDSVTPFLESGIVRFSPRIVSPPDAAYVHDRGDLSSELSGFPLYPTDDILDAFTHLMRFVTVAYEVFSDEEMLANAGDELLTDQMVDPFGDSGGGAGADEDDLGEDSSVLII